MQSCKFFCRSETRSCSRTGNVAASVHSGRLTLELSRTGTGLATIDSPRILLGWMTAFALSSSPRGCEFRSRYCFLLPPPIPPGMTNRVRRPPCRPSRRGTYFHRMASAEAPHGTALRCLLHRSGSLPNRQRVGIVMTFQDRMRQCSAVLRYLVASRFAER